MKNSESLIAEVDSHYNEANLKIRATIQKLEADLEERRINSILFKSVFIPGILENLKKNGMELVRFQPNLVTGRITAQLKPTRKSFRFLTFRGYTSSGSSKNYKRRDEKGKKLSADLSIQSMNATVNEFSLELDGTAPEDATILITYSPKK